MRFLVRPTATLALCLAPLGLGACVAPVYPPSPPPADQAQEVFLLIEGEHAGVILPMGPERWVEYSYGDWGWVVEGKSSSSYAMYALMNATPGALGRREIDGSPRADPIYEVRGTTFQPFFAERSRVEALSQRLEDEFTRDDYPPFHNTGFDLHYVPALHDYELDHHCAHATMEWLQDLGCETQSGGIVRSIRLLGIDPLEVYPSTKPHPGGSQSAAASPVAE